MNAKSKILEAAATLFYNDGIAATGIDRIIAKAGVAKMSLYNNFGSKGELIAAYIRARHSEWLALYHSRLKNASTPRESILAIFMAYQDHAEFDYDNGFRGCGLLNAAAEMPANSPGRLAVKRHKDEVHAFITQHLTEMISDPASRKDISTLANHLAFLLEGAISLAGLASESDKMTSAYDIAEQLLSPYS